MFPVLSGKSKFFRPVKKIAGIVTLLLIPAISAFSQPIPVGEVQDQQYRLLQLLSDSTIDISLNQRPVWNSTYQKLLDQTSEYPGAWWNTSLHAPEKQIAKNWRLGLYEPAFTSTYNSDLPYGGNNGAAWYGRGFTEELQGGFYVTSKYVTATFRPHIIYTQNNDFRAPNFIPRDTDGNPQYTAIFSGIDMPYRFGPDPYSDFNLGQTSLRAHYKNIEAGVSNETLWWGPGIQNALVLSNNAAGLKHAFLGTRAPLTIPFGLGKFEFEFIWAQPQESSYFYSEELEDRGLSDRDRFISGLNFSFSPSFAPNLSIGVARISHTFVPEDGLTLSDFTATVPIINTRQGKDGEGPKDGKNQLVSAYFRWVFPESNAEVYGEIFREDNYFDARDLFLEPGHDRAFTIGFQKAVETNGWFDIININGEINSLVPGRIDEVRLQTYYYRHEQIQQGHTNNGEVLGASIGPGSASQYLGAEGYFNEGSIGFFVQRVAENDYFHYEFYDSPSYNLNGGSGPKDMFRHRVNLNVGLTGSYKYGPLLLSSKLVWNKNYNYGRFNYGELEGINFDTVEKDDIVNFQFQLSARYYFQNLFN